LKSIEQFVFFFVSRGMILSLNEFDLMVQRHAKDTIEYTKKFFHHIKTIVEMTRDTLTKKYHLILKCLQQDQMTLYV